MKSTDLKLWLEEVRKEATSLSAEIDTISADDCEAELMDRLQSSVEDVIVEKRQYRDKLRRQCESVLEDIIKKSQLIQQPVNLQGIYKGKLEINSAASEVVVPPYKPLLRQLMLNLEELNSNVSERSQRRNRFLSRIVSHCERLNVPIPKIPDSLAEPALKECESIEQGLSNQLELRISQATKLFKLIGEAAWYIGKVSKSEYMLDEEQVLSDDFLHYLEDELNKLSKEANDRRAAVEELEAKINSLASTLEVAVDLQLPGVSPGAPERLEFLTEKLSELNEVKMEKLDIFIQNSLTEIKKLWEQLFLDLRLRKQFTEQPSSEEILIDIDNEASQLKQMLADPARQTILNALQKLQQIRANEAKLNEMTRDPGRLSRRGFAASLQQEEKLRRFNERHKPEVLKTLESLISSWANDHDGETFYIEGRDVKEILAQEATSNSNKRRVSLTRQISPSTSRVSDPGARPMRSDRYRAPLRGERNAISNRVVKARPVRPIRPPKSMVRAEARARPKRPLQSRSNNLQPNAAIKPSSLSLPRTTPGKFNENRYMGHIRTHNKAASAPASDLPVKPPSWENDEFHKMRGLEMSYFDETTIQETPRTHQSFNYERDAF